MCCLYEKFILEYYRKEFPQLSASVAQIPWQLDDGEKEFFPIMQSDIMLSYQEKTLIIDAKYYESTMQVNFNKRTIHSANLYQIFTYVKNKQIELDDDAEVIGMLLYAQTDEDVLLNNGFRMSDNKICVCTLDLNVQFQLIAQQLDQIVEHYLGVRKAANT